MEKKKFTPMTTQPTKDNKWFIRKNAGGYSPCIDGSPQWFPGSTLPNCVGWSWGRAAMIHDDQNFKIGCAPGNNFPGNAYAWIEYSRRQGFEIGTTARLGAVAVWIVNSGKFGHVANVERTYQDGSWDSSESGYGGFLFKSKKYPASSYRSGYKFLGFVYPKYDFYIEEEPQPEPQPQEFKIGQEVIIKGDLYYSSNATTATGHTGERRTKITRYAAGAKHPYNTTGDLGWMDAKDIKAYTPEPQPTPTPTELKAGDTVKIIAAGNATSYGTGGKALGIGWTRKILQIYPGRAYPYRVGNNSGTTGFYQAKALKKV